MMNKLSSKTSFGSWIAFLLLCGYIIASYVSFETLLPIFIQQFFLYSLAAFGLGYRLIFGKLTFNAFSRWYLILIAFGAAVTAFYEYVNWEYCYNMVVVFVLTLCAMSYVRTAHQLYMLALSYVIGSVLLCSLVYFMGGLGTLIIRGQMEGMRVGADVTGNANSFAQMLLVASVFCIWALTFSKNLLIKLSLLLALALELLFMSFSGGRKTLLATVLCMVICFVLKDGCSTWKRTRNILIAIAIVFAIFYAIFNVPYLYDTIGWRFESLFSIFTGERVNQTMNTVSSDETREHMIYGAFMGWLDNPMTFLFGHGIDSFKFYNFSSLTGHFFYSHNNYVEMLYDFGIIGFAIYYGLVVKTFLQAYRLPQECLKYKILVFLILAALLFFDIGGVSYYLANNLIVLSIAFIVPRIAMRNSTLTCTHY